MTAASSSRGIPPVRRRSPATLARACWPHAYWTTALVLVVACYACGPFLTLWRINRAAGCGDVATLQAAIDWESVRQGLKEDVAEGLLGMPLHSLAASNTLAPFGSGFLRGIAGTAIDRQVTPDALVAIARTLDPAPAVGAGLPLPAIVSLAFASPTEFDLLLRAPCQDVEEAPMHVRLAFRGGTWQVVRVWLPQDLVDRARESRT